MKTINETKSLQVYPNGYDLSNYSYSTISGSANAQDGSDSTTYATINLKTGSNAETYVYWKFDLSEIPDGATVNSVSCTAKCYINQTGFSYVSSRTIQLYSGTTAKGSATTFSNSTSVLTLTTGTWTVAELKNASIRTYAQRGTRNTSTTYYIRFYGATLTVNYTYQGIAYEITATSSVTNSEISPSYSEIQPGNSLELRIDTQDISEIIVTDNDVDVTDQLVEITPSPGGTIERYPASYSTSGSISGSNYTYCIGKGSDTSSSSGNDYASGGSGSTAYINYSFDFSDIPEDATIDSVSVKVKGHCENASQSSERAELQLYSGSSTKGSMSEFTSTSDTVITMTPGTWTRAELQNAILRFTIGYYGGKVVGATFEVTYSVADTQSYYTYTLTNIQADHIIQIKEAGPFIPPEEDPEKTYYPVTISSINASTNPGRGTVRMEAGTNQTITIEPSETQITLILDNGVDVSNQLVSQSSGTPSYTVSSVSGAAYGFALNNSGYYESQNKGQSQTVAVTKVNLNLPVRCLVTFNYINYAEAGYDYGMFGNIDVELDTVNHEEGSNGVNNATNLKLLLSAASDSSATEKTLTYEVPAGQHFIEAKYSKDQYTNSGNDSLQFKVSIEPLESLNTYTYTLTNIQQSHNLIFVFGNVTYYFVTSSGDNMKLYPNGQVVVLDQDSYKLTIIPNNSSAIVKVTDNNSDVTSQLESESYEDKNGNTITNYIYTLNTVLTNHTINVSIQGGFYIKINNQWIQGIKIYVKDQNSWRETESNLIPNIVQNKILVINN